MTDSKPAILYKYRSLSGADRQWAERMVTRGELYFAVPSTFNDPFESRFHLSFDGTDAEKRARLIAILKATGKDAITADEEARRLLKSDPDRIRAVAEASTVGKLRDHLALFCLSAKPDNVLMWSHYADKHQGVCIGFDRTADDLLRVAAPVRYSDTVPTVAFFKDEPLERLRNVALTKSRNWSYEGEWRSIAGFDKGGPKSVPVVAIKEIIFGVSTSDADRKAVAGWVSRGAMHVMLKQARIKEKTYTLELLPWL